MATAGRGHQEGSRWIDRRPAGKEVADWFINNAPMHPGMDPARYVTGVVLIPAKEKVRVPRTDGGGNTTFPEIEQMVYVPYVKVETRVAYFWDYVRTLGDHAVGEIAAVDVPRVDREGYFNLHLPPGFFRMPVQDQAGQFVHYMGCSMQVRIYTRDEAGQYTGTLMDPAQGTKAVPLLTRWGPDDNAIMKAETGAVGRALGMAGMLVLPGSGVATAEDMQEMLAAQSNPSAGVPPTPPAVPTKDKLLAEIAERSVQLQADNPGGFEEFTAWAQEKGVDLNNLQEHQLRGVLRAIERKLGPGKPDPA